MTAVTYRLQPDGWPVLPRIPEAPCCWCAEPAHRDPPPGSACPVRLVEAAEVLPPDAPRWLAAERPALAGRRTRSERRRERRERQRNPPGGQVEGRAA